MEQSTASLPSSTRVLLGGPWLALLSLVLFLVGCAGSSKPQSATRATSGTAVERTCQLSADDITSNDAGTSGSTDVRYLDSIGCQTDFDTLASLPIDVTIPGVRSMKFVIDRLNVSDEYPLGRLYFQNSKLYEIHYDFVKANIKRTFDMANFESNYYGTDEEREFYLGSISYYEGPGIWALELAGYDTATVAIVQKVFEVIAQDKAFFRTALAFHPQSESQQAVASQLELSIPIVTTDDIYAGTDYQPLSPASSMGVLTFLTAADVSSGTFIPYYSIVVLDEAPNDISVVSGIITEQFQSSLSHVNVLSLNRKTPNMGLRNAKSNAKLLKYKDQWVELTVASDIWDVTPVTDKQGEAYFEAHRPTPKALPDMDLTQKELKDVVDILPDYITLNSSPASIRETVRAEILKTTNQYGGKTVNYAIMALVPGLPMQKAFGIPVYYYVNFMEENGFFDMVDSYLADRDPITGESIAFTTNSYVRQEALRDLRNAMMKGNIDQGLQDMLKAKLAAEYTAPDGTPTKMRFRTSTNSEDLDGFPCAGCYESHTGDPSNWQNVLDAIRLTFTSTWLFRTFEERSYYGIDHKTVGMALLVHPYFPNETANGVAVTANPFDAAQVNAEAYYVNVAYGGDAEVVHLPDGVTTDQFLYYVGASGNATSYISRWNQSLPDGKTTVLSDAQVSQLVQALTLIKNVFKKAYTRDSGWYAMDVEFKFAPQTERGIPTSDPVLWIKQARPYPDPNASE